MFRFPTFPKDDDPFGDDLGGGNGIIDDDFGDPIGGGPGGGIGGGGTVKDTTKPVVSVFKVTPSTSLSVPFGGSASATVMVTVFDSGGVASVTMDGSPMLLSSGQYTGVKSYSYNSSYAGTTRSNIVSFLARDLAGNPGTATTTLNVTYASVPDTTSPNVSFSSVSASTVNLNNSTTTATVNFNVTATDSQSSVSSVTVNNGASQVYQSGNTWSFAKTFNFNDYGFGNTDVTFTATAIDSAGNSKSTSTTVRVTKSDSQAPSISSFSTNNSNVNVSSSNQTVTYTVVATDNRGVNSVSISGASFSSQSGSTYYFTETFATSSYGFGTTSRTRTVSVSDAAGNTATRNLSFNVIRNDVTKPSISLFTVNDSTVTLTTGSQSQTVTYHAKVSDNVGVSSYSLSGASFSSTSGGNYYWTETFSYGDYSFGSTSVTRTVSFSDAAGNSRSASLSLTVSKSDTQAPSISSFSANGNVALNNSTTSVARTFTVNVSDNVGVSNVTVDGLTYSSRSGNNWYFTKTFSFNDYSFGSQTITFVAVATDSAGNISTKNTSISLSKSDTQAPSISSFTVNDSSISLTTSSQSQTVSFAVTATDNVSISSVSVSGATYTGASGNTYNFTKTYSYGSYNFGTTNISEIATVTDSAGNSSTSSKSMTVTKSDNQAPSISAFTVNDSTVSLTTSSQSQTVTFTVTTTDNRGVNSVTVNNGASYSSASGNKYYFTKTFSYGSYGFGNTTNTFTATSTDAAGNSTTASLNITISKSDNQSPVIQSFSVNDTSVNVTTSSTTQTVYYSVKTTDNRGISSVSIPGASHTGTSGTTYSFSQTFSYNSYSFGTTNVTKTVTVADAAGNVATKSLTLTVTKADNQSPIISNYSAANTSLSVTSSSTSATATFTATITDNVAIDYVRFEGNPPTGQSGNTYTYVRTYNYSSLSFGQNAFTIPCYAQDTAGNSALVNETITVSKTDNSPPTISNVSVSRNPSVTTNNQTDTITITADVVDNTSVDTVSIPGASFVSKSGNTYTFTKSYAYDDYGFGNTLDTIQVFASDSGGNDDDDQVQTTVSKTDTQSPTITSFGVNSSTVNLTTSSQTKVAVFTVVASDNVGVDSISVSGASQYSASGNTYVFHKTYRYSNYSFGSSSDTCTLTVQDSAGNTSTDSISMSIVKSDNQAPSINSFSVNDSTVVLLSSSKTQTITFSANVTDNVGVSSLSLSGGVTATDTTGPDYKWTKTFNYDDYNYGSVNQTFTLTATDAAGNSTTSSKSVSIQKTDNQDPSISSIGRKSSSNANITSVTLLASSQNTEVVTFTVNVSDNRGVSNVTLTGATLSSNTATQYIFTKAYAFGSYSFGSTTDSLTATATDAAGNTDTFNTSITVIKSDNVGPTISGLSASSSSVSLTSSAQNTETITFTASISDNVGISSVSFGGLTPSVSGNNYTWTKNYAFGSYSFGSSTDTLTLSVTDTAGNNRTDSVSVSITKTDNVAPTISSYSASATQLTWLASQNDSSNKTVTFTVVTSDDVGVSSVLVSGATQTNVSGNTYTFTKSFSRPGSFSTSTAATTLTVKDAAGNTTTDSITIRRTYTDNVNPTISSFSVNDATVSLTTTSQSQTVRFTAIVTDNASLSSVKINNQNATAGSQANSYILDKTYSYGSYVFGNHSDTVTVTATDIYGNTSNSSKTVSITKTDNQAPNISTFSSNVSSVELTTQNPSTSVNFTVVASDNVSVTGLSVSGATLISNTGNTYGFVKSYAFANYSFGTVNDTITATAIDSAGNSSTSTVTIRVTKSDNTNPTISSFSVNDSSVVVSTGSQSQTVTFSVVASDNVGISAVSLPGTTFISNTSGTRKFQKTYSYNSLNFGTVNETFTVTVTDTLGNTASDSLTLSVTKNDTQNPSISSFTVSDNTIDLTTSSQSQTVNFAVVATDNRAVTSKSVTGASFVSQSGNTFNFSKTYSYADYSFGNSTRTETATIGDAAGNTTTDTLTINISKSDNQNPVISSFSSNLSSITLKTSDQTKSVTLTCVATDNVSVSSVSIGGSTATNSSGNNYVLTKSYNYNDFSFGTNNVSESVVVTDSAGNTSNGSLNINIIKIDDQNPTISSFGVSDQTIVLTTGSQTQSVTYSAVISDNRGVTGVTIDGQNINGSGNNYSLSKTYNYNDYGFGSSTDTVSVVATDSAGNTSTANKTVSISKSDSQNPSISSFSANDNTVSLLTNSQTQTVTFTAVVTDNVGVSSVTVSGATQTNVSGSTYTFTKQYSYGSYNFGSTTDTVTATATDAAGNTSTSSINISITKSDNQNPTISNFSVNDSSMSLSTSSQTQTAIFTAVVSDNVGINSITVSGATQVNVSGSTYTFHKTYNYSNYNFGSSTDVVTLTVSDAAGNSNTDSKTITIVKSDNQDPVINSFTTNNNSFQLTTSAPTKTITYSVNASDNRGISSVSVSGATFIGASGNARTFSRTYNYNDYSFGSNTQTVNLAVTDAAGNTATDTITHTITKIDNQSPTVSAISTNASGNSISLTTGSTSVTVRYTITASDNRAVNSVTWEGSDSSTVINGTSYSYDKTYNYSDYTVNSTSSDTVSVVVADAAGNITNKSVSISIQTADTQDPSISSFTSNKPSNIVHLYSTSQSNTVTFSVSASDNVGVSSVSLPGTTTGSVSGNTHTFTKTYSYGDFNYGDTENNLTVTVSDAAGNTSTSTINMVVRKADNISPTISAFTANDTSVSLVTSSQTQTVSFLVTTTDNVAISSVSIPGTTNTSSSGNNYNFSKTYNYSDYSFGSHSDTLNLTVTDSAGNTSTQNKTITIVKADNANPAISSFTANDTTVSLLTSSQSQTVTFTVVATDNVGVSSVSIPGTTSVGSNGNNYTFTKSYDYGDYSFGSSTDTLTATVSDAAGNSVSDNITINISKSDDQSPSLSSAGNSSGLTASTNSVALKTSDQTKTVTFTATIVDNVGLSSVSFGGLTPSISGNNYTWTKTYNYDDYSFGSSTDTLTLTVADAAGNTASDSVTINISKSDDQNPTVGNISASDSNVELSTSSQTQTVTFSIVASDNVGINSVTWEGSQDSSSISGSTYNFQRTYSYSNYSVGSTNSDTISVVVTDAAGNSTTKTKTITITTEDDQPPVINSISSNKSSNIVLLSTSSQSNTVTFTVNATDNVGINSVTLSGATYSSKSGNNWIFTKAYSYADFSFGNSTDTLTATATDGVGNSVTSTINMSVRKSDDQSPSISSFSANDTSVELKTSSQSQTVTFTVVASDNRSVSSVSVPGTSAGSVSGSNYSFSKTYSYGDYSFGDSSDTLTATVTDAAGNSSTDNITISINKADDQNPSIDSFGADDTTVELKTSSQTQTVTFTAVVSDNVAINTVSLPGTTLSSSNGGTYVFTKTYTYGAFSFGSSTNNLTLTVTDTAGNSVSDTVTISISKSDDQNPSITNFSANDTSVDLKTSSQTQTITFTVVATDNVGISSVSIPGTTVGESGSGSYTFTKTYNYGDYPFGSSSDTLTATVNDAAGNTTTDTITISITKSDDQDPVISNLSANDSSVELKTSSPTQTVTFTAAITDNVSISSVSFGGLNPSISGNNYTWSKTYNYIDYSFGSSTDTITLTVADSTGNTSTDSITISISKSDDQTPTVSNISASDSTIELSTLSQSKTITFSVVATDNVGINSINWEGSQDSSSISGSTYNFQKTYNYSDYSVGSTNTDTISVVVTDAAGNSTTKTKNVTITTEDDQPPVISSLTSNKSSNIVSLLTSAQSNTVTFTVTATDNVGINTLTLTGATLSSTSGNDFIFTKAYSYTDYSFGDTFDTLTATATDGVGNATTSSIQMVIRKSDDQSPTISSFSANDSSVEIKTSSQTQTVTFTVVASDNRGISTVTVPGTTVGSSSGNNYTFNKTYSYGDYSFGETTDTLTATATDAAGNTSSQSVTISITKSDDQDPSISSFSADDNTVSLTTSSQTQTVTFTAIVSDNVGVTSVGLPGTTLSSSNAGTFVFTKIYKYSDYSFGSSTDTLTLTVSDAARNSVTQNINISISKQDNQNPTISSLSADDTSVSLLTSSQSQTVTFTIVASDNVGVSAVSLTGATLSSANSGTFVFTKTYNYADYSFGDSSDTLTATVTDTANNSITDNITISINKSDDQSPSITNFSADDTTIELKTSDQSKTVTFSVSATDNVNVSNVNIAGTTAVDAGVFQKTYHYNNYNFGSNTDVLTVTATDAAGNSESQQLTVTITKTDDQSPVITSVSSNKNSVALKTSDKTDSVVITAVVTDNRAVTAVTIGGNAATNTSGNNYQITKSYNYDNLSLGSSNDTMAVVASDAAGNTSTDSITIALSVVDDEDPTITSLTSDADSNAIELTTTAQTKTVTFTAVASDNIGVSSISLTGATQTNVSGSTYTFTKVYSYADYSFGDNTDTLTLTVTDAAGNSSTTSITIDITKTDNQPPSISNFTANNTTVTVSTSSQTASINITAQLSDNVAISNVSLPGATFVANNSGNYSFTKSYSYADYSFGNTTDTLTLTITDTNNNSTSDTLDITVSKVDNENPTITSFSVSSATVNLTTSVQSVTRSFTVVASDNVAIASVSIPGTTLSSSNAGTFVFSKTYAYNDFIFGTHLNTNTVTVTDTTGNVTTDTVNVTVVKIDNQDPVIHSFSASDTSVELKTSAQTQVVTFTTVVSDNVAINTVSLPGTTLSSSNAGTFVFSKTYDYDDFGFGNSSETLTLTVTDTAGNSVTDTVSVSISKLDDQNPSIASFSANDTSVELTTSSQSQTITFTVVASDNVAVDTVSIPGTTASSVSGSNYLFTKTYNYTNFSFGSTSETLTATVTDTTGNSVTDTIDISISKVDNQPPSISNFVSNASNNSIELKTSDQTEIVTFTVSVADNETITSVALSTATLTSQNAGTFTFSKSYDYDDYSFGNTTDTLTLTALDNHSNSSTATIDIIVTKTDDQAPSISNFTVSDNTIELKSSSQTQSVTFSAVLSDNRAITSASIPNTVSNGNSGTTYNWSKTFNYNDYSYGDTTDTYTLTVVDAAGNTSTESLQISVNKVDDENPVIGTFSANMTNVALFTSDKTQTVTFTAIASDNRAITSYSVPTATFFYKLGLYTYVWTKTYSYNDYTYGTHTDTLTLTMQDAAGNATTSTVSVNVTKTDDLAPTITNFGVNNSTVNLKTSDQTTTLTFSANLTDNVGITTATLPTATFSNATDGIYRWTKEYDYADYNFGSTTDSLTLTVSDAAGNSSTDSITINITKSDDQNPTITSLTSNASGNAILLKSSAKTKTVVFTAVASDNVAIDTISLSNASLSSSNNGTFTFTNEFDYDDYTYGNHTSSHVLSVTDAAGNSVGETINISITKSDDEDPIITNFNVNNSSFSLFTNGTTSQVITFTLVATDNRAINSTSISNGASLVSVSGSTYVYTKTINYSDLSSFGNNTFNFTATVSDEAGNTDTESLSVVVAKIDNQNPAISSFTASSTNVALTTGSQSQTITFAAVASDNRGITSMNLPTATATDTVGPNYAWSKTYSYDDYSFGSSTDVLTVTAADDAGNTASSQVTVNITKTDTQAPSITSFSASPTTLVLKTSDQLKNITFTAVANDNVGISTITIPNTNLSSNNGSTYVFTKGFDYDDYSFGNTSETHTLTVTDSTGNTTTDTVDVVIQKIDDQDPSISSFSNDATANAIELKTSAQSKTVTFTAVVTDNRAVTGVTLTGATQTSSNNGTFTFTKDYDYDDYSFGSNTDTLTLSVSDEASNISTQSVTIAITKTDDQNPTITSLSANNTTITLKTSDQSETVTFTAVVSDNVGINSIGLSGASQTSSNAGTFTFTKDYDYDDYSFGSNTDILTLTLADAAGNTVTENITITINKIDDQDPVISASSSNATNDTITLSTTAQTVDVVFTVTAADNRAITSSTHSQLSQSGNQNGNQYVFFRTYEYDDFSFGSQTSANTITVADAAGNTASVSIPITVIKVDNQDPAITSASADDSTVELKTSSQSQTVTFTIVATDNRAVSSVTLPGTTSDGVSGNNYSFTKTYNYDDYNFGDSTDTLTATATDAAGNSSTQNISISISKTDDQNPSIDSFSADDTTVELKTSSQTQTVTFTAQVSDNVAINTVSLPGTTLSSVNGGTYVFTKTYDYADYSFGSSSDTLTLTIADTTGNSVTDTVTVSISKSDDQAPTCVVSSNNTTANLKTSDQSKVLAFTVAVSDNVNISTVTLTGATLLFSTTNASGTSTQYSFRKTYSYANFSFGSTSETLTATATDTAGNSTTDTIDVTIVKTDDQVPSISSFTADDTSVELKTSSQTQTVTFTVAASDNVSISNVSIPGTTAGSTSGGNYLFTKTYNYSDHSFGNSSETLTATVTDSSGLTATDTITISISKTDDQNPSITSFGANDTTVELKTSSQTQTVTFTAVVSDNLAVNSVSLPGTTLSSASSGTHIFTKLYDYDDYSFGSSSDTLTLTVTDTTGNSVTDSVTISITKTDDQDPTVNVGANSNSVDIKTSSQTQTVTFTVTASDNASVGSVSLPGTSFSSTSGNDRIFTKLYDYDDFSFGTSTETFTATVVDAAGNTVSESLSITVEKTDDDVPTISSFSADDTSVELKSSSKTQLVTFTVIATDNVSVNSVSLPNTTFSSLSGTTSRFIKTFDYDDYNYGDTTETYTVTVTDAANNSSTQNLTINISKVDDENPSIGSFTSDKNAVSLTSTSQNDTVTFLAVFSDNRAVSAYNLPGATYQSLTNGVYKWTKTYIYGDYSYGTTTDTLTLTVQDAAGNSVTESVNISITKSDNIAPAITNFSASLSTVDLFTSAQTKSVTITANISDNVGISTNSIQGATFNGVTNGLYQWTKTYDYVDYNFGSTSEGIELIAADAAGNQTTDSLTLVVRKFDDESPFISSFTASPNSFDLGTDNTSQVVTFSATMNDNVGITTNSLVEGENNSLGAGSLNNGVYTWTKTYNLTDYSGNNHVENFTVSSTDAAGNTASEELSVIISTLSAIMIPGSLSISTSANLTSTDESVFLIQSEKERGSVLFGGNNLPDHFIKVPVNLNSFVTQGSSNLGRAVGSPDDCWGLSAISFDSDDFTSDQVTTSLPVQSGTFKVGEISIDDSGVTSALTSNTSLQTFNVMMTISASSDGELVSTCQVQRADNSVSQTAEIIDSTAFATYLHFSENDTPSANNTLVASGKQPDSNWKGASLASERDSLTDNLTTVLTNSEVQTRFATEIAATNNSINGHNAIGDWAVSFNAITADPSSALSKHARARIGRKASPDTNVVFKEGDKIFTSGSSAYNPTFRDHNNTLQTLASGSVFGVLEQTAAGAFTGTPQN